MKNIETTLSDDITVASWSDGDFEIRIAEAIDFGDVTRYLPLDKARLLRAALDQHLERFESLTSEDSSL